MLFDNERQAFSDLLDELGEHYGRAVSGSTKLMWWRLLANQLDLATLRQALDRHLLDRTRGHFFPQPSDVLAVLERMGGGRPNADEAWALALGTFDETATVCLTDEILSAAGAAMPVWESGDKVGARMAFKAAYERVVDERRLQGQRPCWQLSLGWDPERRALAAQAGLAAGRLSPAQARPFLPAPPPQGPSAVITGLLTGTITALPRDAEARQRQRLQELRNAIAGRLTPGRDDRDRQRTHDAQVIAARDQLAQRKRQALAALARLASRETAAPGTLDSLAADDAPAPAAVPPDGSSPPSVDQLGSAGEVG